MARRLDESTSVGCCEDATPHALDSSILDVEESRFHVVRVIVPVIQFLVLERKYRPTHPRGSLLSLADRPSSFPDGAPSSAAARRPLQSSCWVPTRRTVDEAESRNIDFENSSKSPAPFNARR